eukprot:1181299-Prymnesium_polylepis.1
MASFVEWQAERASKRARAGRDDAGSSSTADPDAAMETEEFLGAGVRVRIPDCVVAAILSLSRAAMWLLAG